MGIEIKKPTISESDEKRLRSVGLISIEATATLMGVSVRTVRRLQAAGRMPPRIHRGHREVYRLLDVLALGTKVARTSSASSM
jgi:hypothetical protein